MVLQIQLTAAALAITRAARSSAVFRAQHNCRCAVKLLGSWPRGRSVQHEAVTRSLDSVRSKQARSAWQRLPRCSVSVNSGVNLKFICKPRHDVSLTLEVRHFAHRPLSQCGMCWPSCTQVSWFCATYADAAAIAAVIHAMSSAASASLSCGTASRLQIQMHCAAAAKHRMATSGAIY
jgi:hypothetical protein